jgi:hypothetical protein
MQHDLGADVEGGAEPAEAAVEAERQQRKDDIAGGVAEGRADALARDNEVPVLPEV